MPGTWAARPDAVFTPTLKLEIKNSMNAESQNTAREAIRSFILRSVQLNDLNDDDNLFETGIVNSLFAVQLMTFLEKHFKIEVTTEDLDIENFKSVHAAATFVLRKSASVSA